MRPPAPHTSFSPAHPSAMHSPTAIALLAALLSSIPACRASSEGVAGIHNLELDTFYADCTVYDKPELFGGPVCGHDDVTYSNCVHLACLNHWRDRSKKVRQVHKGKCEKQSLDTWSPIYSPVCATDGVTYANAEALAIYNGQTGQNLQVQFEGECQTSSDSDFGIDASLWQDSVCATNGRTYSNITAVADMRKFGQCLDVLHDGGCTVDEVKERIRSRAEVCDLARNYYEYNPVCADDGVTYANPYIMLCYRPNVKYPYMGECGSLMHQACQGALDVDTGVVQGDGEVCASDGLTYTSIYHLDCATNNDKHLYYLHEGACTAADNPCSRLPLVADGGTPVCGSDSVTYTTPDALWCVQRKDDPFLRFFHDGACFRRCVECKCNAVCPGASSCTSGTCSSNSFWSQPSCPRD